ncbi:tectonin beta-propeller repeat-containing protein 2 [Hippocampus zosterae]|uniref:tectonin beta-propeller repeat-containing protein 2 n=1 Tax=Hippocampus zosterae TaxID=109293 RepID=UPI00223E6769|nr:tectonin beta-propeller repeat-containing protein 2 [Hippocampus zosterae]XP_051942083.1 tectonin beta-propeller repeat-containing protein 2 [Hippocampus zosterae]
MESQPSVLREFCPLQHLLNAIPAKVQRGFRSVVVYLTAVDSSRDFVAVGSSIGMLYLYCRRLAHMNKYSLEGKCDAITSVKLLSCFDDLVAAGTASGRVAIFQLVSPLPGRNKQLRRFDVVGLHKGTVTSLSWSANGMKLFSGDDKGRVVFSTLDLDQGTCTPVLLLEETCGVVQLDYSHQVLLVSTQQRSLLYCTHTQRLQQLGAKPRKSSGRFGACFLPALCKSSDLQAFAARPGLRLWRSDVSGHVVDTGLLKDVFNASIPHFEILARPCPVGAYRPPERQLGLLSCFLKEGWILSWNEYSVYVVDYVKQVLVGALESGGDIVSLSCCDNEIFILKGDRDLIRLSDAPEGVPRSPSRHPVRLSSPLTPQGGGVAPTGWVEVAQPIRTMAIIVEGGSGEGGGSHAEAGREEEEEAEEAREKDEDGSVPSVRSHSRSSSVTSWDSLRGNSSGDAGSRRYSAPLGQEEVWQELVVKAVKVKKKKRQRRDGGSGNRLSESSCSESKFVVQDGGSSDGGSGASLLGSSELPKRDSPTEIADTSAKEDEAQREDSSPAPRAPEEEAGPLTPNVDVLLECAFSYVRRDGCERNPTDRRDQRFLGPVTQAEADEEDDSAPPAGATDQPVNSGLRGEKPSVSSDDDESDIYRHGLPHADVTEVERGSAGGSQAADGASQRDARDGPGRKAEQLAECWMGYSGPGCGILSLHVTDRYVWCLDFKGGLYCSLLPDSGLQWQRFEDNVHQVALSPSGHLLWKVEQRSMTAYACAKVAARGERHWYKAATQTAYVALGDDSAWIIRTNGDLYLQTGLSAERPCARSVKVDTPCVFSQVCVRGGVVWALSEHNALFYREGLDGFCSLGDAWKYDTVSEAQGVELMCVALGDGGTAWALDVGGRLFFRTGVSSRRPQGHDDHWWQVSISDYVVFDQGSLVQTLLSATQSVATVTRAPVERVVAFLSQYSQRQPSLVGANAGGVWVASGRNRLHLARGGLVGTFWQNLVPRGTVAATRWSSVTSSAVPHKEGAFLWLAQSKKDLFCVWDQDGELRPSTVTLPPEAELTQLSACRDALWGLDAHGRVFIRTLSSPCPAGLHWTSLDLGQLGSVRLVSISCGSQNVWALDSRGLVYFRVGTQPLNPNMMLPAWIHIEPPEQPVGVQLVSIETSPNDCHLWALDNRGAVFVRTGLSNEMPVGTNWDPVPGLSVSQLVLSRRTVWVRCVNGDLARRYGVSDRNPAGDYWKKIPGNANWLTVTPDDDLWAVTAMGGLARRMTKLLPPTPRRPAPPSGTNGGGGDDVDDEWELL